MPDSKKQKLKELIDEGSMMIADAQTLTWARNQKDVPLPKGLGGGNYLIVLGVFAVYNFLSKINYLLSDKSELWSGNEVEIILTKIKADPDLHGATAPREGSLKMTEVDCFIKFTDDVVFPIFNDQQSKTEEDYRKLWSKFRGKLSHIAMPGGKVIAVVSDYSYEEFEQLFSSNTQPAAFSQGEQYAIFADHLARDAGKWVGALKNKIDYDNVLEEKLDLAISWIELEKSK